MFTVEEINLLCIYSTDTRIGLLRDLFQALLDVSDPELRVIINTAAIKLENMTDAEYINILPGLIPAEEYDDEEV